MLACGGIVAAGGMTLASTAYACTYDKGSSVVSTNGNNTNYVVATGDRTTMYWCNKNYASNTNGTPVTFGSSGFSFPGTNNWTNSGDGSSGFSTTALPTVSNANGNTLTWSQYKESSNDSPNCNGTGKNVNEVSTSSTYFISYVLGDPRSGSTAHNCHNSSVDPSTAFPSTVSSGSPGSYVGKEAMNSSNSPEGTISLTAADTKGLTVGDVSICLQDSTNDAGNGNFDANLTVIASV